MKTRGKKGVHVLIFLAVCAAVTAGVMLLWNALIPEIVGWGTINYWQALGLLVLCRVLLGGIGHLHPWGGGGHPQGGHFHLFHKKMAKMSPEERRAFIRRRMCGFDEPEASAGPEETR